MNPRRIGRRVGGGPEPEEERRRRERTEALREAFSRWATGVTIVAVREGGKVHALTVSAFMPLSMEPPLVLISLGPNSAALPYLESGTPFGISLLTEAQQSHASRYADSFPVGPSPFSDEGPPVVEDALATLVCRVGDLMERGDHTLVIGRVDEAEVGSDEPALIYFRRSYHSVA